MGQLLVWEWQSETYILKQQGHYQDLNTVCWSPDGSMLATGGDDAKVKLWNASSGFCFVTFAEHTASVTAVAFTTNGSAVLSSSLDGTVRARDLVRYLLCLCLGLLSFVFYRVSNVSVLYLSLLLFFCFCF